MVQGVLREKVAVCLSGGGYRAMLFHIGALRRLADAGLLPGIDRFCSVSGGSIAACIVAMAWDELAFDQEGVPQHWEKVEQRAFDLAGRWIDVPAVINGLIPGRTPATAVAHRYRRYLFGDRTLRDLPGEPPRFVFTATNLQTGALLRASRSYVADYRIGMFHNPDLPLADVVAASSAFPPFLSPMVLQLPQGAIRPPEGDPLPPLGMPPYTTRLVLTDGGVYDNLGLEPARSFRTVLVSDGGGLFAPSPSPPRGWLRQMTRAWLVTDNQVRSLRRRQLVGELRRGDRQGAYWGIGTNATDYPVEDALPCPFESTRKLAAIGTKLRPVSRDDRYRLINWGYAVADAALRSYVVPDLLPPAGFPHPLHGVG